MRKTAFAIASAIVAAALVAPMAPATAEPTTTSTSGVDARKPGKSKVKMKTKPRK